MHNIQYIYVYILITPIHSKKLLLLCQIAAGIHIGRCVLQAADAVPKVSERPERLLEGRSADAGPVPFFGWNWVEPFQALPRTSWRPAGDLLEVSQS